MHDSEQEHSGITGCRVTYESTIFYNEANKFSIIVVKTNDPRIPLQACSDRYYGDRMLRFTAVGYELPRTKAVELELDGEWVESKYGYQLQVEQWQEIVPQTADGLLAYLGSGLIKGIGPKTAEDIVATFGPDTLNILDAEPVKKQPEAVKATSQEADPLDAIMADDMPVPEQVTAEVVEKPKTVVLESVQPAQTPAAQPQNVIVLEQKPPAAAYTQSSPVEEICRQMTYEQAQNVIVDCGTCKGWTLAQVADRRPASLRWYVKGYQGENNILRAAAAIIWDSLQEKQAG